MLTLDRVLKNPVPFYLTACYCYEELAHPILADHDFDALGRYIRDNWPTIDHPHKYLINPATCASTSGITKWYDQWPMLILDAAHTLTKAKHGAAYAKVRELTLCSDLWG